jgi:signal transduction histidine kinase
MMDQEPGVPPAEGDPELLVQILRNLYENAVKYSPGGGEIRTVIAQEGGWVSIQVQDNGLGISQEHVPHVFERFRRPGAEPTVRGMGLGLYLSRLLVDAQGGRIHAASPGPGKGATFMVELPMVPDWEQAQ